MDEFVDQVRSRSDLLQVVQSYVPLKRKGSRYWGCCPFHHEKTPPFSVVPDKGFFYCFGCHAGGDVFKFLSLIENVTYFEAIKMQAEKLGVPVPARQRTQKEIEEDREIADLRKVNTMARDFYHNCLTMTRLGTPGKTYFAGRGITDATIDEFQLGFAPAAWDKLSDAFQKRGVTKELLLKSGLVLAGKQGNSVYDRFRNRVIIPIADERGRVVGFGGRVLDDSTPKYLNTPETILFNKRKLLFGLDRARQAIQQSGYAIVVEGYMDAISVFDAGIHNVVASLGTAFTPDHARLLRRYAKGIYFCYDSDEAGQNATIRALSIVNGTELPVHVIVVPDGKDPDEYIRKHGADAFRALVKQAQPLLDYRLQYVLRHVAVDTLAGKRQAMQDMMPVLASVRGNTAVLSEYKKKLAKLLYVDEEIVTETLRHYHEPSEPVMRQRQDVPQRHILKKEENAQTRAGRTIIQTVWQNPEMLAHALASVPLQGIGDPVQREILTYFAQCQKEGRSFREGGIETKLSEEASAELSRAIAESIDDQDQTRVYMDSLAILEKAYLNARYIYHSSKAASLLEAGDVEGARKELDLANKINEAKRV